MLDAAPAGPFRAFEVGCGAGTLSLALSKERPDVSIVACDISPALVDVAQSRSSSSDRIQMLLGDAELIAPREGPFDLIFSRHGVMFFSDPKRAFRRLRDASTQRADLIFSCFQDWTANPWASELASAAAGRNLPPPGRAPGGFAFADPDYVEEILSESGWSGIEAHRAPFTYVAAEGPNAVDDALSFLGEIGPASVVVQSLPEGESENALERMRCIIEQHFDGSVVAFAAAAWIWRANASQK